MASVHVIWSRVVRAVVLIVALGFGGVAGIPTMALPPPTNVTMSGPPDDDGGGGGGGDDGPDGPDGPLSPHRHVDLVSAL